MIAASHEERVISGSCETAKPPNPFGKGLGASATSPDERGTSDIGKAERSEVPISKDLLNVIVIK